jgi:hypothetical protein
LAEQPLAGPVQLAVYRVWQFFAATLARLSDDDRQLVHTMLGQVGPEAENLFYRMGRNDQRHAVAVLRSLLHEGYQHLPLSQAALLHDVGKTMGQPLLYRVAVVLLRAFAPRWLERLAQGPGRPMVAELRQVPYWRRPFVVHVLHPEIGASLAAAAGCGPLAVELILFHQLKPPDTPRSAKNGHMSAWTEVSDEALDLLRALQRSDARN